MVKLSFLLLFSALLLALSSTDGSSLIEGVVLLTSSFSLKILMLLLKLNPNRLYLAIRLLHFGQSWLTGLNKLRITGGQQHKLLKRKMKFNLNTLFREQI